MNKKMNVWVIVLLSIFTVNQILAQGVSRPMGVGVRGGFLKSNNPAADIAVGPISSSVIAGSGAGGMLYFFSRIQPRWYLEAGLGEMGGQTFVITGVGESYVGDSHINPYLFGARYDLLTTKQVSILQPYLSSGIGIYSVVQNLVEARGTTSTVSAADPDVKMGLYLGSGLNILLASWFALNIDLKYHMIDLKIGTGYSGPEYSFGFSFMWGSMPEIFEVEDIRVIVNDIYPAYYQFYNTYPLALVTVKNMVSYPIEVNLTSRIDRFSDRSNETGFIKIAAGEAKDLPVHAFFGPELFDTKQRESAVLDLDLVARAGATHTKSRSVNIIIHSRNAWNGEMDRLGFFLTPDDDKIMNLSRNIAAEIPSSINKEFRDFELARRIFNELSRAGIRYQNDPNIPFYQDDYVQFAVETTEKSAGDCDDLVVLYASLLESVGINTAFVEVRDPEEKEAHLYILFDSGVLPEQGHLLSTNDKRLIIRENTDGRSTLWIPVETTLIESGFEEAWGKGALHYLEEAIIRSGLNNGWVKLIDID